MSDNRPIGVLDSGLGGLTAVRDVLSTMPGESLVYFGDTGRVPYGTRSPRIIEKYTRQDISFLLTRDIKALIVACGTISSAALPGLSHEYPLPMIGVLDPACRAAAAAAPSGRIGVIGTAATIASGAYEARLRALLPGCRIVQKACPLFVPLVESGRFHRDDRMVQAIVADYLSEVREMQPDVLVLGCTHYPILKEAIADFMGSGVTLIDVGLEAARFAARLLADTGRLADRDHLPTQRYFVSDAPESFARWGGEILGLSIDSRVERVEIEDF